MARIHRRTIQKKGLNDWDNHNAGLTHLGPDSLDCEVKWALGNFAMKKTSGSNEISAKLLQILKCDADKVLHSVCQ